MKQLKTPRETVDLFPSAERPSRMKSLAGGVVGYNTAVESPQDGGPNSIFVQIDFTPVSPSCSVRWDRSAKTEKSLPRLRFTSCRGTGGEWSLVRFCKHQTETVSNLLFSHSEEVVNAIVARPVTTIAPGRADLNPIGRLF